MKRNLNILIHCLLVGLAAPLAAYDIPGFTPDQIIPFKQTVNSTGGAVTLNLHVFTPPGHQPSHQRPAIVYFFGGGWVSGSPSHFHPQCEYLASRGMVAISAEYRVKTPHGTTPQECVKDGKSAIRYVRQNAAALGVDPNRIAAGGGSAGGHVAAAAGTLAAYEEAGENLAISSKPNALVIYNGVVDNGPGPPAGWGYSTVQAYWQTISPLHNITATAPPTTLFLGTNDSLVPVSVGTSYQATMEAAGRRCDLHFYQGQPHSFFNYDVLNDSSGPYYGYRDTLFKTDEFLVSLGWLAEPHAPPVATTGWVTILGNAAFSGGSAATASPVLTDADGDAMAANFSPLTLADRGFVRLTGSVTFNAPLNGDSFRIGLFDGDNPVTAGDGGGYAGIWASAPATAATSIAVGNGSASQPFDNAAATTLGPIPAAAATLSANTPLEFSLMIARNGDKLDIAADFNSGTTYRASQNLLNLTSGSYTYDSVAFLIDANLNATQAAFSNIQITRGTVISDQAADPTPPPTPGQPATLIDDTFDNAVRLGNSGARTGVDRDGGSSVDYAMAMNNSGGAWSSDTNAPRVASGIDGNSIAVTNTGVAYSLSTYFTPATLAAGDSISVSFNVRTSGYTVIAADTAFRFGLFDSNTGRLGSNSNFSGSPTTGTTGGAIGTVFQDDRGYSAFYDTTTAGTSTHEIRERINAGTIAWNTNVFGPTAFSAATGGATVANTFATGTTYPVTLNLTRSSDGLSLTTTCSFNGINLSSTDTADLVTEFDHLAVLFGSQFGSSGTPGTQLIDDVVVIHTPAAPVTRVRVILLGGQSNADGRASSSGLPATPVNLQQPQNDVDFFYKTEGGSSTLTTLRPGLSETSQFGPEITLGRSMADLWSVEANTRVAIIKYANGGTNLQIQWKAGGDATTTGDGPEYLTFQQTVTQGLAALTSKYPTAVMDLQGMVWMQGESDAANSYGSQYQTNLATFIADVRATYGTDLPFLIGRLSAGQTSLNDTPTEATQFNLVRDAQTAVAAAVPRVSLINTDTFGMNADNLHFNSSGQQALGNDSAVSLVSYIPFTSPAALHQLGNGDMQITVSNVFPGWLYTLENSGTLSPGGWSAGDSEIATGTTIVLTYTPDGGAIKRFFRVARAPAP